MCIMAFDKGWAMAKELEIREAKSAEVHAIAALLNELNREEESDVLAQVDDIARALFGDGRAVDVRALLAVEEAEVIGVVIYYPGYDTLSASYGHHLADIIVTKQKRGRGIGRLLVKALAKVTRDAGKEWVSLTVLKRNDAAQEFYKALGMTQVSVHFFAAGKSALQLF